MGNCAIDTMMQIYTYVYMLHACNKARPRVVTDADSIVMEHIQGRVQRDHQMGGYS